MHMFSSLFLSKQQKLVKKWSSEHKQMLEVATYVIEEYSKNSVATAKKKLREFNELTTDHLMNEDLELYRLEKDGTQIDENTLKLMHEFEETFKGTKVTLMQFLARYTKDDAILDEEFFNRFNELVVSLTKRIEFEEANLYAALSKEESK